MVTKRFKDIAMLAIDRMERDLKGGLGKSIYKDYIRIINEHFIPSLGQRLITNIDYDALQQYYDDREARYGLAISNSNRKTQNAAFNRVFDEAIVRGYLTESNRPKLDGKTKESVRRPAFELHELRALLKQLGPYIESGRTRDVRERREILRDYVEMLVDTGARPGIELLDMKWKQIRFMMNPISTVTDQLDEEGEVIEVHSLNRSCEMTVKGKTGQRQIIGRLPSVRVLERIAMRIYGVASSIKDPLPKAPNILMSWILHWDRDAKIKQTVPGFCAYLPDSGEMHLRISDEQRGTKGSWDLPVRHCKNAGPKLPMFIATNVDLTVWQQ